MLLGGSGALLAGRARGRARRKAVAADATPLCVVVSGGGGGGSGGGFGGVLEGPALACERVVEQAVHLVRVKVKGEGEG